MEYVQCLERDRIQALVAERFAVMQRAAQEAARIAGQRPAESGRFQELTKERWQIEAEIRGLRLALEVHRSIHGC